MNVLNVMMNVMNVMNVLNVLNVSNKVGDQASERRSGAVEAGHSAT